MDSCLRVDSSRFSASFFAGSLCVLPERVSDAFLSVRVSVAFFSVFDSASFFSVCASDAFGVRVVDRVVEVDELRVWLHTVEPALKHPHSRIITRMRRVAYVPFVVNC